MLTDWMVLSTMLQWQLLQMCRFRSEQVCK